MLSETRPRSAVGAYTGAACRRVHNGTPSASVWPLPRRIPGLPRPYHSGRTTLDAITKHAGGPLLCSCPLNPDGTVSGGQGPSKKVASHASRGVFGSPMSIFRYFLCSQHTPPEFRPDIRLVSFGGIPLWAEFFRAHFISQGQTPCRDPVSRIVLYFFNVLSSISRNQMLVVYRAQTNVLENLTFFPSIAITFLGVCT